MDKDTNKIIETLNQPPGGMSRRATLILFLSMFAVVMAITLRLLLGGAPDASIQNTVGLFVVNTLLIVGLFALSLRYLENKKKRTEGIVMAVLLAIMFAILVIVYLHLQ